MTPRKGKPIPVAKKPKFAKKTEAPLLVPYVQGKLNFQHRKTNRITLNQRIDNHAKLTFCIDSHLNIVLLFKITEEETESNQFYRKHWFSYFSMK